MQKGKQTGQSSDRVKDGLSLGDPRLVYACVRARRADGPVESFLDGFANQLSYV